MRVLVTRPREQARATADALRARGHQPLVDPVIEIRPVPLACIELDAIAAIVVTSANAVPALTEDMRRLPLFCVGSATARAVREAGWVPRAVGNDDGAALAGLVAEHVTARPAAILHLRGEVAAESTALALQRAGFEYRSLVAYRADAAEWLSPETEQALRTENIDAVLFFSPRSAETWCRLAEKSHLTGYCNRIFAICLSAAIGRAAGRLPWAGIRIAAARDQTALLDCLDGLR